MLQILGAHDLAPKRWVRSLCGLGDSPDAFVTNAATSAADDDDPTTSPVSILVATYHPAVANPHELVGVAVIDGRSASPGTDTPSRSIVRSPRRARQEQPHRASRRPPGWAVSTAPRRRAHRRRRTPGRSGRCHMPPVVERTSWPTKGMTPRVGRSARSGEATNSQWRRPPTPRRRFSETLRRKQLSSQHACLSAERRSEDA